MFWVMVLWSAVLQRLTHHFQHVAGELRQERRQGAFAIDIPLPRAYQSPINDPGRLPHSSGEQPLWNTAPKPLVETVKCPVRCPESGYWRNFASLGVREHS